MKKKEIKDPGAFYQAVLSLKNLDECYSFFEDICTLKEVQDMSGRFEVARLINEGNVYSEIARMTGTSTATISRVNKCLYYGSGGYKTALERMKEEKNEI